MAIGRTIGVSAILSFGLGNSLTNMGRAKASFKDLHDAAKKAKQGLSDVWSGMQGMTRIGAVAALGVGWGIKTFANFDAASAALESRLEKGGLGIEAFREKALSLGKATKFTATDILGAMDAMKRFGLADKDVMGQIFSVAKLATAENMTLANSARMVFMATGALGWPATKSMHALDLLAYTAGHTASTIPDLVNGLKLAGSATQLLNIEGEQAVKVLGLFSNAALYGTRGGTVFTSFLNKMAAAAEDGKVAVEGGPAFLIERSMNKFNKKMGVNLIQTLLNAATSLMSIEDETQRAAAGFQLLGQRGARFLAAIGKFVTTKDQAGLMKLFGTDNQKMIKGFMDKMFLIRQRNLRDDWIKLTSAVNTFGISMSRNFGGRLRGTVQKATSYISDAATAVDHYTKNWSKLSSDKHDVNAVLFANNPQMNRNVADFVKNFLIGMDYVGKKAKWVYETLYSIVSIVLPQTGKGAGSLAGKMTGIAVAVGGITAALFLAKLAFGPFLRMGLGAARLLSAAYMGVAAKIGAAKAAQAGAAGASKVGSAAGKLNKLLAQPVLVTNWPPGLLVPGGGGGVPPIVAPGGAGGAAAKSVGFWARVRTSLNTMVYGLPLFGGMLASSISGLGLLKGGALLVGGKLALFAAAIAAVGYASYKLAGWLGATTLGENLGDLMYKWFNGSRDKAAIKSNDAATKQRVAEGAAKDFADNMLRVMASGKATANIGGRATALSRENVVAEIKNRLAKRGVTSDDAQQKILEKLGPLLEKFNLTSEGGLQNKLMTDIYSNRPINLYIDGTQVASAVDKHKLGLKERDLSTKAVKPKRAATLGALGMKGAGFFPGR